MQAAAVKTPFYKLLYVQVLVAIVIGGLIGWLNPKLGIALEPLGTLFIKLIKMLIGPIIFCTIVTGIAGVSNAKSVGTVGGKAILYFEIVSTFALVIGVVVANFFQPGAGFQAKASSAAELATAQTYIDKAKGETTLKFISDIIPDTMVGAFTNKDLILPILFIALLFGFSLLKLGEKARTVRSLVDEISHVLFGMLGYIMKLAPLGALGAMAFTIGRYGPAALGNLFGLIALFYLTAAIFIFGVLGTIAYMTGFNIFKLLRYLKSELLLVLGTSSSESALAPLMDKLERLGCEKSIVRFVVPTGYSFNLDGTNIYITLAALFIAQASGVSLSWGEQALLLGVAMLTSKGASGVTGSGFIVLAGTLAAVHPELAVGVSMVFGIDKFMSECRALTNIIGNSVAAIVVSAWENGLDRARMHAALNGELPEHDLNSFAEVDAPAMAE
ncbi:MAG: C4-dicarboxylate transporter DctA [Beijerinckiaceae bacterium]|nr:C4-dicarboxylate transporter DctA [Beijerinckiaceae bacterium]